MCGGTVLRCLTDKKEDIKSEACQKEVLYFEKMEVSNYNNDVILAAACKSDVEKLCANVEPGKAACLSREHRDCRGDLRPITEACSSAPGLGPECPVAQRRRALPSCSKNALHVCGT